MVIMLSGLLGTICAVAIYAFLPQTLKNKGIDIAAKPGTPVVATAGGVVTLTNEDMLLSGKTYSFNSTTFMGSILSVETGFAK